MCTSKNYLKIPYYKYTLYRYFVLFTWAELPVKRVARKCEQLENLATAVQAIAKPGHVIVDFCSGAVCILYTYIILTISRGHSFDKAIVHGVLKQKTTMNTQTDPHTCTCKHKLTSDQNACNINWLVGLWIH